MPLSLDFVGEHRGVLDELPQGVGQLNFSVLTWRRLAEDQEDLRRQDIPADDGEIRRRIGGRGFLDQVIDPVQPAQASGGDDAVSAHLLGWNFLYA